MKEHKTSVSVCWDKHGLIRSDASARKEYWHYLDVCKDVPELKGLTLKSFEDHIAWLKKREKERQDALDNTPL